MNIASSKCDLSCVPNFADLIRSDYTLISSDNVLKLNKITCRGANNASYCVIRYDKDMLCSDLISTYGLCRSIIINSQKKIVGYAPPKSIAADTFIKENPMDISHDISHDISQGNIIAEEFVEGTMINVFFDPSIGLTGGWEISTRNTVGATSSFYKSPGAKTFRTMFMEAASECNLDINQLDPKLCYSFVLQHPANRIVVPFKKPELYLVAVYYISDNVVYNYRVSGLKDYFENTLNTTVKFPQVYPFENYSELVEKYASMNTPYYTLGVVIHNVVTGQRTKIRNPVYEEVRNLRGNQPKLQYQYLSLRKEGRVKDFLKFYPENKSEFSEFRDQVHLFTNTLFSNYVSCYIKKEKQLKEFSEQYRTHMYNIHQIYINDLRLKKQFVTNIVVQKYVNDIHPTLLMYCLNYNMRKRKVDTVIADSPFNIKHDETITV
jgi:hypothetical protein